MSEQPGTDRTRDGRAAFLAEICRVALDARDASTLFRDACALMSGVFGAGAVVTVESAPVRAEGTTSVVIPRAAGAVVVVRCLEPFTRADIEFVETIAGLLAPALERIRFEEALRASEQRMLLAQHIAHIGSYDWDIATDTNAWSDELYRIYGTEPQSFNASYEKFLSFIHPDDRERIVALHKRAYETGESYQMEERIIRPDGEVRVLSSNGKVIRDASGIPVRMVGVCMDVTEQRLAEETSKRESERFRALIESAPDAVLVIDPDGAIVQTNQQAEVLFGYSRDELSELRVDDLLAPESRARHAEHRASYLSDPKPRPMGTALDISARRKDGTDVYLDVGLGVLRTGDGILVAAFARDATPRREAEIAKRRLGEIEQRRRQALEINDNVVQGLVAALTSIEAGRFDLGAEAVERTLRSARGMMNDLLGDERAMQAGELVRERPAESHMDHGDATPSLRVTPDVADRPPVRSVVIADDSDDLRFLLKMLLSRSEDFEVVDEACDGQAAIESVRAHRPDLILLDLAMPRMDGLEAVPAIRKVSPETVVVVVSGFDSARMSGAVSDAGADAYIEKDASLTDIAAMLMQICDRGPVARAI
ncbi:MAG TPA: PAS domain S-box protein [Actinomycetota bacterium]|nr:PAS domain S-box protein [Actinomycetota bacterium]